MIFALLMFLLVFHWYHALSFDRESKHQPFQFDYFSVQGTFPWFSLGFSICRSKSELMEPFLSLYLFTILKASWSYWLFWYGLDWLGFCTCLEYPFEEWSHWFHCFKTHDFLEYRYLSFWLYWIWWIFDRHLLLFGVTLFCFWRLENLLV